MFRTSAAPRLAATLMRAKETSVKGLGLQQKRALSIHEYLSAGLLERHGVGVPKGKVARSGAEAENIAKSLGGEDMVIKAQVLAGGRGKGTFDNGLKGGVRVIYSPTEAKMFAAQMIGHKLITKQTGAAGRLCSSVFICERKFARREFYLAILMDRQSQGPAIIASSQGGMDIETVARETPDAIITTHINIHEGVTDHIARNIATRLGFSDQCLEEAMDTIKKLYRVFVEKDATQIEINPLAETSDHKVLAMDAKLNFDDNAEFRQKEVFSWRDTTQEDPDEVKAAEHGLNFIKLDGDIGCLVNGAGLAMATMDIIKLNGGQPANFLDVGGGATAEAIQQAFTLITGDPKVTSIFVNIFGGIVRCDAIAQGLISVVKSMNLHIPIIARLQGTNMEQAHALISDSGLKIFSIEDLQNAAEKSVQLSKVVKMARDIDVGVEFSLATSKQVLEIVKDHPKNILAYVLAGGVALVGTVFLPWLGFAGTGPIAGSWAAAWQAAHGPIAAGSVFSSLQSAAMTWVATKLSVGAAVVIAAGTAATGWLGGA
ncbi:MAG: Succinate--CoA ligase [ADP-forming] subunit beta, mitochondrial [Peltula sp. TS41687]|nr:MAG: Succinate--CoA ligase [ADP-forming] subunit beta, mitochondrial [Peltula sp. TS41687]